jgi:sarcosine oxidase
MIYDAIVVGVGGMGSASVYHLARRGQKVLGIEQYDIPNDMGSSHGNTRIIRLAYAEHPDYVPLLHRAYEIWRALEHQARERLLIITGGLDIGRDDSDTIKGSIASCDLHHLRHQVLDATSLGRRFPGYTLPPEMLGVYQPDAGFLLCERCVVAHVAAALDSGAEIHARERVLGWNETGHGISVRTDRSEYRSRKLIVTAGPWTSSLLSQFQEIAIPERQVMLWTQPLLPDQFLPGAFPVFNMEAPEGRFYGFPVYGTPGFKIGKYHHRHEAVRDLDNMDRTCHLADEEILRVGIRRYFPQADGPTLAMKVCLFTNSPDEHFILDFLPGSDRIAVAAGFSGHGFKFCSVVGEIMSDIAIDGASPMNPAMFQLNRSAIKDRWLATRPSP